MYLQLNFFNANSSNVYGGKVQYGVYMPEIEIDIIIERLDRMMRDKQSAAAVLANFKHLSAQQQARVAIRMAELGDIPENFSSLRANLLELNTKINRKMQKELDKYINFCDAVLNAPDSVNISKNYLLVRVKPFLLALQQYDYLNYIDKDGFGLLHYAIESGNHLLVEILLENNVDVVNGDILTMTAHCSNEKIVSLIFNHEHAVLLKKLQNAIQNKALNHTNIYDYLPVLNMKGIDGQTPLMLALLAQDKGMVNLLINTGADVNAVDNSGNTALHLAIIHKIDTEVIKLLINHSRVNKANKDGKTAFRLGAELGDSKVQYNLLCSHGVRNGSKLVRNILENNPNITIYEFSRDAVNYEEATTQYSPLLACAQVNNQKVATDILDSGLLDDRQSALDKALLGAVTHNQPKMVEFMLQQGADKNYRDQDGISILIYACEYGSLDMVKLFVEKGAIINQTNKSKVSAISVAAFHNKVEVCEYLIANKADKKLQNKYGDSPLEIALRLGNHKIVKALVENDLLSVGYTDLMVAILDGEYTKAEELINKHSNVNNVTDGGYSALMIAANKFASATNDDKDKIFEIIMLLLHNNANLGLTNKVAHNFIYLAMAANIFDNSDYLERFFDFGVSDEFKKNNNGKNIFHYCVQYDARLISQACNFNFKYVQYINDLDDYGCSPLSYLLFDTYRNQQADRKMVYNLLNEYPFEFIRNNKKIKTKLHLKALLAEDNLFHKVFADADRQDLNVGDENGRTPLHYAYMLSKTVLAEELVAQGADITIKDRYGRTPIHYAAMKGMIPEELDETLNVLPSIDVFGLTPVIYGLQYATNLDEFCSFPGYNDILQANVETMVCSYQRKLAILACQNNYRIIKGLPSYDLDYLASKILASEVSMDSGDDNFADNIALGIELEIPELENSYIPKDYLIDWFPVDLVHDATVAKSVISPHQYIADEKLEFVSNVLHTPNQYHKFLLMCSALSDSGSKVNRTAGMHLHVNCRGTTATQPPIKPIVPKELELTYLKYVLLNFISIEQLLRGFMRDGALYNEFGSSYVQLLSNYREQIINCNSVEELQVICSHNKTLDLTALDKHGTVEFRVHEGTVDPILLNAWVDCITRLVNISLKQTLEHKDGQAIEPKQDIEQLVYLLIVMRDYNKTWSAEWGGTKTADIGVTEAYPGNDKNPAQIQIQQAPLYNMMAIILYSENIEVDLNGYLNLQLSAAKYTKAELKGFLSELKPLVIFAAENKGILSSNIDQAQALDIIEHFNLKLDKNTRPTR